MRKKNHRRQYPYNEIISLREKVAEVYCHMTDEQFEKESYKLSHSYSTLAELLINNQCGSLSNSTLYKFFNAEEENIKGQSTLSFEERTINALCGFVNKFQNASSEKPPILAEEIKSNSTLVWRNKAEPEIKMFANRIYIELTTRKAAIPIDENHDSIEEIYNSWYKLFCTIRDEMKNLPAIEKGNPAVELAVKILNEILRPHLTEHQAKFRNWLEKAKRNPKYRNLSPQELQKKYPKYQTLIISIKKVNETLIVISEKCYEYCK